MQKTRVFVCGYSCHMCPNLKAFSAETKGFRLKKMLLHISLFSQWFCMLVSNHLF